MVSLYSAKVKEVAKLIESEEPKKVKRKYTKKIKPIIPTEVVIEETPIIDEEAVEEKTENEEKIINKIEKVAKKAKIKRNPEQPPKWFTKFHENIGREQSALKKDKKPVKLIKQDSLEIAEESWQKPTVREKVKNEVDSHMTNLYKMIFSDRKM